MQTQFETSRFCAEEKLKKRAVDSIQPRNEHAMHTPHAHSRKALAGWRVMPLWLQSPEVAVP